MGEYRLDQRRHRLTDVRSAARSWVEQTNAQFRREIGERQRRRAPGRSGTRDQHIEIGHDLDVALAGDSSLSRP
jgi:hypothetical protein